MPQATLSGEMDQTAAALLARQVEAARRHLQAALVISAEHSGSPRGGSMAAIEQALSVVSQLARDCRESLDPALAERTFPGEARFLCAPPWEHTATTAAAPDRGEPAAPAGLARLLRALGYEAQAVTGATGAAGVQLRSDRYSAHIALVEPAGGGRQRWSGALEWVDSTGASRTWAETLGPVELDEEELARRVDELLRRNVGAG